MRSLIHLSRALLFTIALLLVLFLITKCADAAQLSDLGVGEQNYSSILNSLTTPSYIPLDTSIQVLGQKNIPRLQQDYINQTRDYDMRQSYGLNSTVDEQTYIANMQGFGRQVIGAARNNEASEYASTAKTSQDNGDIAQPLVYAGAVGAFGMGTPVKTEALGSKIVWNGDAMRQHGELNVTNPLLNTRFEIDQANNPEHYRTTVSRALPLDFSSSLIYGSTTSSLHASLSRPLWGHIAASVDTTMPVGTAPNMAPGATCGLSYGVVF